ncbi:dethiobiotin synthase [Spongisporangium articulatum]|uniref:ATP-dependent dethiobiotin synthetase BioD n=1 Tax=Spongisporangium articulatum TaxID=3362603 RepID=A0ABW8AMF9_9ACTN
MSEIVAVTGTNTEIGKTVATAALAAAALRAGRSVCVVKPVQTGVRGDEPGDVHEVARRVAPLGAPALVELLRLPEPMAPEAAADRAGVALPPIAEHAERIEKLAAEHDLVLVEGAGGVLVRLDTRGGTLADLARLIGAQAVVVTPPGLGTLNVTELTVEALTARGVTTRGIVVSRWPVEPGPVEQQNLRDLPRLTGVPLLGVVPELAPGDVPTITRTPADHA